MLDSGVRQDDSAGCFPSRKARQSALTLTCPAIESHPQLGRLGKTVARDGNERVAFDTAPDSSKQGLPTINALPADGFSPSPTGDP